MTLKDLSHMKLDFRIRCTRQDYVHAFVIWFDIVFSKCHKPVYFSTCTPRTTPLLCSPCSFHVAPTAKYTHWRQSVFYLEDVLTVNEGDEISGTIDAKPNEKNHRDWDITIHTDFDGEVRLPAEGDSDATHAFSTRRCTSRRSTS